MGGWGEARAGAVPCLPSTILHQKDMRNAMDSPQQHFLRAGGLPMPEKGALHPSSCPAVPASNLVPRLANNSEYSVPMAKVELSRECFFCRKSLLCPVRPANSVTIRMRRGRVCIPTLFGQKFCELSRQHGLTRIKLIFALKIAREVFFEKEAVYL